MDPEIGPRRPRSPGPISGPKAHPKKTYGPSQPVPAVRKFYTALSRPPGFVPPPDPEIVAPGAAPPHQAPEALPPHQILAPQAPPPHQLVAPDAPTPHQIVAPDAPPPAEILASAVIPLARPLEAPAMLTPIVEPEALEAPALRTQVFEIPQIEPLEAPPTHEAPVHNPSRTTETPAKSVEVTIADAITGQLTPCDVLSSENPIDDSISVSVKSSEKLMDAFPKKATKNTSSSSELDNATPGSKRKSSTHPRTGFRVGRMSISSSGCSSSSSGGRRRRQKKKIHPTPGSKRKSSKHPRTGIRVGRMSISSSGSSSSSSGGRQRRQKKKIHPASDDKGKQKLFQEDEQDDPGDAWVLEQGIKLFV